MIHKKDNANSQTLFNIISTVVRTGIATFTLPIFTRLLGTSQYGSYNVYMSELDPLDSIQLISVWFIDETTQDTLPLKKEYFVFHDEEIKCFDSIQSTPLVIKLDPNKVDSSNKNKDMRVHIEFYPNLTKKHKTHTFSISYHIKVNEEDIIINNRKLIIIRLTHGFRNLYDYFLWPFYLIC